ncbi:MAG: hypothetical protein V4556_01020 [Bacteroidota bacterium]
MNTTDASTDLLNFTEENKPKIPQGLNVLTILTFIGCAFGLLVTIATPFIMKFSLGMMDKATSMNPDMGQKELTDMENAKKLMALTQQHMGPLIILGLLGIVACFIGALWMRKLKKDGFWVYVAGQIIPIAGSMIFLGTAQYQDWKSYFGLIIPLVFIVLYSMQRKHLVR